MQACLYACLTVCKQPWYWHTPRGYFFHFWVCESISPKLTSVCLAICLSVCRRPFQSVERLRVKTRTVRHYTTGTSEERKFWIDFKINISVRKCLQRSAPVVVFLVLKWLEKRTILGSLLSLSSWDSGTRIPRKHPNHSATPRRLLNLHHCCLLQSLMEQNFRLLPELISALYLALR